jgi:hypothetical protein
MNLPSENLGSSGFYWLSQKKENGSTCDMTKSLILKVLPLLLHHHHHGFTNLFILIFLEILSKKSFLTFATWHSTFSLSGPVSQCSSMSKSSVCGLLNENAVMIVVGIFMSCQLKG